MSKFYNANVCRNSEYRHILSGPNMFDRIMEYVDEMYKKDGISSVELMAACVKVRPVNGNGNYDDHIFISISECDNETGDTRSVRSFLADIAGTIKARYNVPEYKKVS